MKVMGLLLEIKLSWKGNELIFVENNYYKKAQWSQKLYEVMQMVEFSIHKI